MTDAMTSTRRSVTIPQAMVMTIAMSCVAWAYNTIMADHVATLTLEAIRVERDRCTDRIDRQHLTDMTQVRR